MPALSAETDEGYWTKRVDPLFDNHASDHHAPPLVAFGGANVQGSKQRHHRGDLHDLEIEMPA